MLDIVSSLADKSLVVADTSAKQERYRVLETNRQYAQDKLAASGERERIAGRHAEYYRGVAQTAQKNHGAMALSAWLATLEPEVENLRATLEWTLGKGRQAALGGSVAGSLEMFWWHAGVEAEGIRWIDAALRQLDESEWADIAAQLRRARARLTSRILYS